jgi:hypothetical protein
MKTTILSILFFCFIACSFILCSQESENTSRILEYSEFSALFENPPATYRSAPLWVWHDRISEEMIDRDFDEFKEKGFGGAFIHPRSGLITEYLSQEWFDRVKYTVEKSKELGLYTWIYDENSYPSGFAGGIVPAEMPESWNQGQGFNMKTESVIPDDFEKYSIILSGTPPCKDVTGTVKLGDAGSFYLFEKLGYKKSKWHAGQTYVDLLVPGVTEKFIDVTMKAYENAIGDEFGKTVPGVFTDEPNISSPSRHSIRWTPALFDEFQTRRGYDLKVQLPSIFNPVGEWKRVRHDYYETLLELFIERWSIPTNKYTEEKNLLWTGHYWEHGWPSPHHGGDNMAMYAYHQMPAVDMLFNTIDENHTQFGNVRAVKELSSIANQLGRHRTLSETYGGAGWELRFEDMKRLGDWQCVLGVNFMNQHITYMNLTGDRKHDYPQGISYHAPWWDNYKVLNDYFARLSMAMASGFQINKILVLEPTTTTWMYHSPTKSDKQMNIIGGSFANFVEELEHRHIEFDIGCENTIKDHGSVKQSTFTVGQRDYDVVVIPPFYENIDAPTLELLQQYVTNGGELITFAEPERVNGAKTDNVKTMLKSANCVAASSIEEIAPHLACEDFQVIDPMNITGDLFHQRRQLADGQLLLFANTSLKETSLGEFQIVGKSVMNLDAVAGTTAPYPSTLMDDAIRVNFELQPAGSLLLYVSTTAADIESIELKKEIISATNPSTVKRLSPNMITLDYCDIKVADETLEDVYYYDGGYKIWQAHGYKDNPWVSSVQWKTELVDADTFKTDSGFEARYAFKVQPGVELSSLRAVVEQPNLWTVQINDETISPIPEEWAIDKTFGVFDISKHVKSGENEIAVIMHPMSIYAEIEPVYIMGKFDLISQKRGWTLAPETTQNLGAWKSQGMPFYAYDVAYEKTIEFEEGQKAIVRLGAWGGTVAEVHVNGDKAGIIGWQPYELDVSDFIVPGENKISVIVSGSLKNLLGPHHNIRRKGIVTPGSFKSAPTNQPAGVDYDQLDYGLFEDFQVILR